MNRRKLTGVVASLVVAGLGTVILLKSINSDVKTALPPPAEPTVSVLKVLKPIPKGTPAASLGDDSIAVTQVRASEKLADTVDDKTKLAGLVASQDLYPNEQVVQARFVSEQQATDIAKAENKDAPQNNGLIGVWVALEPLQAMNGILEPSVAVFATFTGVTPIRDIPGEPSPLNPSTSLIIHKAVVLDCIGCKKANGLGGLVTPDPAAAAAAPAPAAAPGAAPVVALPQIFVKLGVDAPAAERLVFASKYGSISLFSEDQSVIEANTKVIDRSNVYQTTPRQVPAPQAVTDDSDAATNTAGATPAATPTSDAAATTVPASPTIAPASAAPVVKPVAAGLNAPAATVPSVGVTPAGK